MQYQVLIKIRDDKKKKVYLPGDKIQTGAFPKAQIETFLRMTPPVLEKIAPIDKEVTDG